MFFVFVSVIESFCSFLMVVFAVASPMQGGLFVSEIYNYEEYRVSKR